MIHTASPANALAHKLVVAGRHTASLENGQFTFDGTDLGQIGIGSVQQEGQAKSIDVAILDRCGQK